MFSWLKNIGRRIATYLMLALYNTEKSSLGQQGSYMGEDMAHFQSINQGTMLDDLLQGRVTQEVQTLRWRMYKVLAASANIRTVHKIDSDGKITYTTTSVNKASELRKVQLDAFDDFAVEMVIDNRPRAKEAHEAFDGNQIEESDKSGNELDEGIDGNPNKDVTNSKVVGEISSDKYFSLIKSNFKLKIGRTHPPKFKLEEYTKKLNVRSIDHKVKLLEFCVSKYPKEYDRRSDVFIKNVLKIDDNPRISSVIDFDEVSFTTYNDIGVHNNKLYIYDNLAYDKTVEFNGYYIIKMTATVVTDGEDLTEQYRMADLDERYENKEQRDENSSSSYVIQF